MQWPIVRALQCDFVHWLSSTPTLVALKVVIWTVNGVGLQTTAGALYHQHRCQLQKLLPTQHRHHPLILRPQRQHPSPLRCLLPIQHRPHLLILRPQRQLLSPLQPLLPVQHRHHLLILQWQRQLLIPLKLHLPVSFRHHLLRLCIQELTVVLRVALRMLKVVSPTRI